ncbi:MAG: hypothetical protein KF795_24200 [Labilithrix sp.]|nr:hypothetical protein [Labilithrix sp.]
MRRTSSPSITLRSHCHAPRASTARTKRATPSARASDPDRTRRHALALTSGVRARIAAHHSVSRLHAAPTPPSPRLAADAPTSPRLAADAPSSPRLAADAPSSPRLAADTPTSPRLAWDTPTAPRLVAAIPPPPRAFGVAATFGVALGAALISITLGVVGPSRLAATFMLALGAALAAIVATRREAVGAPCADSRHCT